VRHILAGRESGMTLIELMVAVPLAAMIAGGVAGMVFQMMDTHNYVSSSVRCYREVQAAGSWFSRDAVQAQRVTDENYGDGGTRAIEVLQDVDIEGVEVFIAEWIDWNDEEREVVYSILTDAGSGESSLQRSVFVDDALTDQHIAARHLDATIDPDTSLAMTRFEWSTDEKQVVRMIVTANVGLESVTRFYEVRPRALVQP